MSKEKDENYCDFCRTNRFDNFDKHLRTNLHKNNYEKAMKSQDKKFQLAKQSLNQPNITTVDNLDSAKKEKFDVCFWCYFCCDEFRKHWVSDDEDLVVENGGLVGHFVHDDHRRCIIDVRKRYRCQINCDNYAFKFQSLKDFVDRVEVEKKKFLNNRNDSIKETALKFQHLEHYRTKLVESARLEVSKSTVDSPTTSSSFLLNDLEDIHPNEDDIEEYKINKRVLPMTNSVNSRMRKQFKQNIRCNFFTN